MTWKHFIETEVDCINNLVISEDQRQEDFGKELRFRMASNTPAFPDLRGIDAVKNALLGLSREAVNLRVAAWRGNHQANYPVWAGPKVIVVLRDGSFLCWGPRYGKMHVRNLLVFDSDDKIHLVWSGSLSLY